MKLTFADLQEIRDDEIKLKEITGIVHTTYAQLCALCRVDYSTMKPSEDDDDEDDEEATMSACRELVIAGDLLELKDLSMSKGLMNPEDMDLDLDEEMRKIRAGQEAHANKQKEDSITFEGVESSKDDSQTYSMKDLFRMVRQASHPDKIMRFSATTKEKIINCFHECKEHYADDNYPAMVLCYVEIFLLRSDPRPINHFIWKYVKIRHKQIKANIEFIMAKPYMPAITAYRKGQIKAACVLFKQYWESLQGDPMDDMDCFD